MQRKQEERQEDSSKASDLPRRQMKAKEFSKRKRDNSHHREKNLTEETRDEGREREEKRREELLLIIRPKNAKQKQSRSRKCRITKHTSRGAVLCAVQCFTRMEHHATAAEQTGTPLIGTYHRRGEYKKQEIVAQARPWRRQKKRHRSATKKNILPFSVSARRFGFGPSPFPARLVIVEGGPAESSGRLVGFSKNPRFRFFPTLHNQRTAALNATLLLQLFYFYFLY